MKTTFKTLIRNGEYIAATQTGFYSIAEPELLPQSMTMEQIREDAEYSMVSKLYDFHGIDLVEIELTIKPKTDE